MKQRVIIHDPRLASVTGGGEALTLRKLEALDKNRFAITILTQGPPRSPMYLSFKSRHPDIETIEVEEVGVDPDKLEDFLNRNDGRNLWGKDNLTDEGIKFNCRVESLYGDLQYDLVSVSVLSDLFGLNLGVKTLFNLYGCPPVELARPEAPILEQVGSMSAVSRYIHGEFEALMGEWGILPDTEIITPGLPLKFTERQVVTTPEDPVDFVYAGRLTHRKGVDLIIRSVHELKSTGDFYPEVVIAGDGPSRQEFENLSKNLGVDSQIRFTGALTSDELIDLLDRAYWFLYPVRKPESFGMAPLEAMARGVPAIVGTLGGMQEYIMPGVNSIHLETPCVESLARAMSTAGSGELPRKQYAANSLSTASQYSWSEFSFRVNSLFASACDKVKG